MSNTNIQSHFFPHDSIFGFLNMFKRQDRIPQSRPAFPIINYNPTGVEVYNNLNKADLALVLVNYLILGTFFGARASSFLGSAALESQRRLTYSAVQNSFLIAGIMMAMNSSRKRLQGVQYNGLMWERYDGQVNKYDFTSEIENRTVWGWFRSRH